MYKVTSRQKQKLKVLSGLVGAIALAFSSTVQLADAGNADNTAVEAVKKELLNDTDFVKAVGQHLNNEQNDDHIRQVVKDYLIKNPEVMLEVQDALNDKQEKKIAESQASTLKSKKDEIFNSPNDAVLGNPNGSVTLVEFFDYNCGYCKKSYPDLENLIKSDPKLRVVIKDFPILGPDSVKAHIVARAVMKIMPEKYAEFHKELLTIPGRSNEEKAIKIAEKLGVDEQKLRSTMQDESLQQAFVDNGQLAYALGINGTPSYILGNNVLVGAVGENILKAKIAELEKN